MRDDRTDSALLARFDYGIGEGRAYKQERCVLRSWCTNTLCNSFSNFFFALRAVKLSFGVGALTRRVWRERSALAV